MTAVSDGNKVHETTRSEAALSLVARQSAAVLKCPVSGDFHKNDDLVGGQATRGALGFDSYHVRAG